MADNEKGPIQILCDEIGFHFDRRIETTAILNAFVSVILSHVVDICSTQGIIHKKAGGKAPSQDSAEALRLTWNMLACKDDARLAKLCTEIHDLCHQINPDEGPCDHLVDMVSSCVSAIRFGIEKQSNGLARS